MVGKMRNGVIVMDLYHSWVYVYILNTKWFVSFMVSVILGGNIAAPIIIWCVMSGRPLPFISNKSEQNQ